MARKARAAGRAEAVSAASTATPVVGIGASAGGVLALRTLFEALPPDAGAAYVVIVHLDPEAHSELPQILATRAHMPVVQVTRPSALKPNCVYVIPPDRRLRISEDEIWAEPFDAPHGRRSPIDDFFRSLAEQHGDGFAVVMTGAGADGSLGVKAVKEAGGIILVQDPEQAEYASMPRSAIATGVADFVLPIRALAAQLVELIKVKAHVTSAEAGSAQDEALRHILSYVRARTGHDFTNYKRSTILRRLIRRMQVARRETLEDYAKFLRETSDEAQALLGDLLISVTTFFRDPKAFDTLAKLVIPELFKAKLPDDAIRVWVPGCATGEEAYSLTMLLLEEAARHDIRPEIQVFGSDMDARALATARDGRYPAAIEADVGEARLRRFFNREEAFYRIKRELRDTVLFTNHSLLKDPPFSRLDLISCRNLLIYLDRELQQQVLATLHYGLEDHGYLFLGSSETAETRDSIFRLIDRDARIYRSTGRAHDGPPVVPRLAGFWPGDQAVMASAAQATTRGAPTAHREALERLAPPSVLVDSAHRVLHLSETAGRYLQPPGGPLASDITELVRQELRFDLRGALNRAFGRGETVLTGPIDVRFNGSARRVLLQVKPVELGEAGRERSEALVLFLEDEGVAGGADASAAADGTVERLKQDLELAQSRLRTTREEAEAANEELRAANEELQSINEEYRSTAEELETSREELQSINEELQTVNSELKFKLDSVSRANSDLHNLMAAMDFGTLFLDSALRINRFTPKLGELFSITPGDIGRPITDFAHQLDYDTLADDAQTVLKELTPIEREVGSRTGRWYLARFRPYRTVDDKIDGVVVTFLDVTERRGMEEALRARDERQRLLLDELTHRVKNILTVVQGVVHQTWRAGARDDFLERVDGRLAALAESQNLLVASDWRGADLQSLIEGQLAPHVVDRPGRLRLTGGPLSLPASVATPLGLVLHELATNAVKYGAFSNEKGHVDLSWTTIEGNPETLLKVTWQEHDGPPVRPKPTSGFGSRLIRHGLPGATVRHEFEKDGVTCEIEVPLPPDSETTA